MVYTQHDSKFGFLAGLKTADKSPKKKGIVFLILCAFF
jgi:hypothetical protein